MLGLANRISCPSAASMYSPQKATMTASSSAGGTSLTAQPSSCGAEIANTANDSQSHRRTNSMVVEHASAMATKAMPASEAPADSRSGEASAPRMPSAATVREPQRSASVVDTAPTPNATT